MSHSLPKLGWLMQLPAHNFSALTTDLYEVTMACGYFKAGATDHDAVFHVTFRANPFAGHFTMACGLATAIDFLRTFHFTDTEIDYLSSQRGNDGKPLFDSRFLDYLRELQLTCDIDAIPEGTLVFPDEPLIRIVGPIIQCQLLETALLNIFNFQSLIATKAARVCLAAKHDPVIEFGLRRSQGVDGGLTAARAAYIGGCAGTSNLQAGQQFGIPVSGTQAHSWIMSFENEREAFQAYAEAMPNNCIFLVDTYDSIDGIRHAIEIGRELRRQGHEMIGVRLDSGDGAALSNKARRMLDKAGFVNAKIVGSGDLDEYMIADLKQRGAKIDVWGVGTKLSTGQPDAALGVIYKLGAIRRPNGEWQYRIKLSEESAKISIPGSLQVRRFHNPDGKYIADAIYETDHAVSEPCEIVDVETEDKTTIPRNTRYSDLLVPIFRAGKVVYEAPSIEAARDHLRKQLSCAPPEILQLNDPAPYKVGLERSLYELRSKLIARANEQAQ
ncbi:MAG TPA: nicotinate phosphoribosyltransferase [Candidatus Udaeobacter sp.]|nr:nicotinate phosphoribosyltransferase [Candidatus Udaeobacter sp.]